jgi:hypothetical protein
MPAMFLVIAVSGALSQNQKLTPEEVLQKHYAAVGTVDRLSRAQTRIGIGSVNKEDEPIADFYIMSEREKVSAFYKFRDYDFQVIFDGSRSIIRPVLSREASPITVKYEEIASSGFMFNGMSVFSIIYPKLPADSEVNLKGTKKVAGRQAYVLQLKSKKGAFNLYFDTESFMWVRTDFGKVHVSANIRDVAGNTDRLNEMRSEGGSETTVDFYIETSDFREVDGIKLPFKFVQVVTAPILRRSAVGTLTGTIKEYRHNEPIDPRMFK